jgi:hypothetical protein
LQKGRKNGRRWRVSLSSSRSNTVDLPTDSPEETDAPREEPAHLLSLEPSGPGVCGKRGKESTEESATITIAVFVRYMVVGRSTQIGYRAIEKKRGRTEDDEKDTVMGICLLGQRKTEEQQLQSPEIFMFDSSDDLKVQAWNYVSSSFSNEYTL